jgi:hypothetical protein
MRPRGDPLNNSIAGITEHPLALDLKLHVRQVAVPAEMGDVPLVVIELEYDLSQLLGGKQERQFGWIRYSSF